MFPILNLFGREVPTYSIAAGAGILLAVLYLRRRKAPSICEADKELAFLYALAGALVGAKLFWLLSCWEEFCAELPFLFSHTELFLQKYLYSGLMFYGGLYGSAA
ncbi:MAG: prolipoprotein diacylglyceryl transferase family protein, partial [bacterium]